MNSSCGSLVSVPLSFENDSTSPPSRRLLNVLSTCPQQPSRSTYSFVGTLSAVLDMAQEEGVVLRGWGPSSAGTAPNSVLWTFPASDRHELHLRDDEPQQRYGYGDAGWANAVEVASVTSSLVSTICLSGWISLRVAVRGSTSGRGSSPSRRRRAGGSRSCSRFQRVRRR